MRSHVRYTIILVFLAAAAAAIAQVGPSAPAETELIIPDLVLQVEELGLQEVTGVLPAAGELALGRITLPLPQTGELAISDEAFRVAVPGTVGAATGSTVFSTGRLGAGTVNHVVGELSLFKLGDNPRFRLRFAHEGLDGFQFKAPGTGFYSQRNAVDGWLLSAGNRTDLEAEAAFTETIDGMQGVSDYFSVGLRTTRAVTSLTFRPDPLVELGGSVDGSMSTRILSASGTDEVPTYREFAAEPGLSGRITVGSVGISLDTRYFLRFMTGNVLPFAHDIDATAGLDLDIRQAVNAAARFGVHWDFAGRLVYPWSVRLSALLGDSFEAAVGGGYRIERQRLADLWARYPLAAPGDSEDEPDLIHDRQWYGELSTRYSGASGLALQGGVEFVAHEAAIDLGAYSAASTQYDFVQRDLLTLVISGSASWRPSTQLRLQAGAAGRFIDAVTGQPTSSLDFSASFADRSERLVVSVDVAQRFYPAYAPPRAGMTGSFSASEGVEFVLELSDLFAPLGTDGRAALGPNVTADYPFIEPGFRASIFTRISL